MYDASKETDKDFLRAALKQTQEKVIFLEKELALTRKQSVKDAEICKRLSEELLLLRKSIWGSKKEEREKARERARLRREREKKRKNKNLPHNRPANPAPPEDKNPALILEQETEEHNLEGEGRCPGCGGEEGFAPINAFEESGEIEVVARRYIFKRHRRRKYHCKCCKSIVTAPSPAKLVPGGEFSVQVATQVAVEKYEHHIPLNRQKKQMAAAGLEVGTRTLFGITEHLYNLLFPLEKLIRGDVLGGEWVHVDESPMPFYNPRKSTGYIWSMGNTRGVCYQFEPNRKSEVAGEMLKGYAGVVVTDGYHGYNFLNDLDGVRHAYCWSHVLRKFIDALSFDESAQEVIDCIDALYDVEHEAFSLEDLSPLRREKSRPLVEKIDDWVDSMDGRHLKSTKLGEAIHYYSERRTGLGYFLEDVNVPIDNNMAERRQRCPVMGRKNFLHFKSIDGADVGAFFYSVVESCKTNGLPPGAYINEMAHRVLRGEGLESPYQYSTRLNEEIGKKLGKELEKLQRVQGPP